MATSMQHYKAPNPLLPHDFRQALKDAVANKKPLLGFFMVLSGLDLTRFVAQLGFDCPIGVSHLTEIIHTTNFVSDGKTVPVVRLPGNLHHWAGYALDAGAGALVFPQIDTVEQAKHAVAASRYPPLGTRSMAPFRLVPGISDIIPDGRTSYQYQNDAAAVIVQIESVEGLKNAEEIAKVPGVDCLWYGALDMTISMNMRAGVMESKPKEVLEAQAKVFCIAKENGIASGGIIQGTEAIGKGAQEGTVFVAAGADVFALLSQKQNLESTREALEKFSTSS